VTAYDNKLTTRSTNENMITFEVGLDGNAVFLVPEDRIRASSEFADAAMRGPWQESQERVLALPDFDRKTFGIYFQWLITGVVHSKPLRADENDDTTVSALECLCQEILGLPRLFDLGSYLLDTDFRDTLSDVLMQCASELHCVARIFPLCYGSIFYDKTPDGSPIRKPATDLVVWNMGEHTLSHLERERKTMDSDFAMDLLLAMTRRRVSSTPGVSPLDGWQTSCKYHCHGNEKPCYRKKASQYVACPVNTTVAESI
jgi:hypothetical protein